MKATNKTISVVIPAKNEAKTIGPLVLELVSVSYLTEIIVVDDGSTDNTGEIAKSAGAIVITHPYSKGNGASIKSGTRKATGELLIFMDGDGQHSPSDIPILLDKFLSGFDMVIGSRSREGQANLARWGANSIYNKFSSWMTGQHILDLTSGFRIVRANLFNEFLYLLPNGFSYPTTSTMAFFRAGYTVGYVPIHVHKRQGKSHINIVRDGIRFLMIIFKVGTLYSPLKIFFPMSFLFFLTGLSYYLYTFINYTRFTNMSGLLLSTAVIIFLIGLVSEQITTLMYMKDD